VSEPRVSDNRRASRYEIEVDGKVAGFVAYRRTGSTIAMTHTEVDPAYEGRGLGSALVRSALDAARAESAAVRPFCPFVRQYIKRHPEYLDLVPEREREQLARQAS
jgi:predicted GNAT family acetyltransferase